MAWQCHEQQGLLARLFHVAPPYRCSARPLPLSARQLARRGKKPTGTTRCGGTAALHGATPEPRQTPRNLTVAWTPQSRTSTTRGLARARFPREMLQVDQFLDRALRRAAGGPARCRRAAAGRSGPRVRAVAQIGAMRCIGWAGHGSKTFGFVGPVARRTCSHHASAGECSPSSTSCSSTRYARSIVTHILYAVRMYVRM